MDKENKRNKENWVEHGWEWIKEAAYDDYFERKQARGLENGDWVNRTDLKRCLSEGKQRQL